MKWKIDYPYVVCIVFDRAGIWMNYLSIKTGLERGRMFRQRPNVFYQQVIFILPALQVVDYTQVLIHDRKIVCRLHPWIVWKELPLSIP
nr:hypothetical protein [Odoribacter splanchnicus]